MSEIQSISQGNYLLQSTVATSAGIVGDGSPNNPLRADETVLWNGQLTTANCMQPFKLTDSASNYDTLKFYWEIDGNRLITYAYTNTGTNKIPNEITWLTNNNSYITCKNVLSSFYDNISGTMIQFIDSIKYEQVTTAAEIKNVSHNWAYSFTPLKKIVGINRKNNA